MLPESIQNDIPILVKGYPCYRSLTDVLLLHIQKLNKLPATAFDLLVGKTIKKVDCYINNDINRLLASFPQQTIEFYNAVNIGNFCQERGY